jgi:hypothetical protein
MTTADPELDAPPKRRSMFLASLEWIWRRYSPNGEFPLSSLASFALYIFLIGIIPLLAWAYLAPDQTQPAVDVIRVADAAEAAPDDGTEFSPEDGLQMNEPSDAPDVPLPETVPAEQVEKVDQAQITEKVGPLEAPKERLDDLAKRAAESARRAQEALDKFNDKLNHGNQGKSGDRGSGTARGARPARWVLHFRNASTRDYMEQLEGLGASIAFPDTGDKWRFYSKPASNPSSFELRDLNTENRLYWKDDRADSVRAVADFLGVRSAPFMTAFLPLKLEDRMLQMELSYKNLEEDEIASTHFEVVARGGGYDVIVVEQIPK